MGSITITLADDVAERVKRESEARGSSIETTVNDLLRQAIPEPNQNAEYGRFPVLPLPLGEPLVDITCTGALDELDDLERYRDLFRR